MSARAAKKPAAKKSAAKKSAAKKPVKPAAKKTAKPAARQAAKPTKAVAKHAGARADYGAPIDAFFAKQPPALQPIARELRALIEKTVPAATASIKWGMPFFALDGAMLCAIGGHKAHVNLILPGPEGTFDDPDGLLTGESKNGKHLKLVAGDQVPREAVTRWLKASAARLGGALRYA